MTEFFQGLLDWYMANINYWTITLLMAIESSFIPLPSEIVIPPAAWKAAQGDMNIYLVVVFGSIGALLGSLANYFLAMMLGRPIIYRLAKTKIAAMMFINPEVVKKAEDYFNRNGNTAIFLGRLMPAVRHLISIPAGLSKMNLKNFIIYTFLGAAIWNVVLALLGYFLYTQKDVLHRYFNDASTIFLVLGILFVLYLVYKGWKHRKNKKAAVKE